MSSPPLFSEVRVARMCSVCTSLFVVFRLTIVLSVHLRLTEFDCPFGIFKLFVEIQTLNPKHILVFNNIDIYLAL